MTTTQNNHVHAAPGKADLQQLTVQEWLATARCEGTADAYAGKRTQLRFRWDAPVMVESLGPEMSNGMIFGYAKDISEGGLGLRLRTKLAAGTTLRVSCDGGEHWVYAKVQHCTTTLGGYVIGLSYADVEPQPFAKSA